MEGRDHRCSLERTLHGVDVMTSILKSGESGQFVTLTTTCTRPPPLASKKRGRCCVKDRTGGFHIPRTPCGIFEQRG
jgi:hypothetical protein